MPLQLNDISEKTRGDSLSRRITKGGTPNHKRPSTRAGVKPGYNAYCNSDRCCRPYPVVRPDGKRVYRKYASWAWKDVSRGTTECPDCHFALLWVDA